MRHGFKYCFCAYRILTLCQIIILRIMHLVELLKPLPVTHEQLNQLHNQFLPGSTAMPSRWQQKQKAYKGLSASTRVQWPQRQEVLCDVQLSRLKTPDTNVSPTANISPAKLDVHYTVRCHMSFCQVSYLTWVWTVISVILICLHLLACTNMSRKMELLKTLND